METKLLANPAMKSSKVRSTTQKQDILIYDTTLRDGSQTRSVSFSVQDKILLTERMLDFGMDMVEIGFAGSNDIDSAVIHHFKTNANSQDLSRLAVFGMTRRPNSAASQDSGLNAIISSGIKNAAIVGKSWDFHVTNALGTTLEENLAMIGSSVELLVKNDIRVIFDAEHFFDGFTKNETYALECIKTALKAGSSCITLCDTNGGMLPSEIRRIVGKIINCMPEMHGKLGIHCHNDTDCASANTIEAVIAGVSLVQGTINGLGERCGNANLCTLIPNFVFKLHLNCGRAGQSVSSITQLSSFLSAILNEERQRQMAYVGSFAFTHKGGIHASAVAKAPESYEHIAPELIGNSRDIMISGQAGRANLLAMLKKHSIDLPETQVTQALARIKQLEATGYNLEDADASFAVLITNILDATKKRPFEVLTYRAIVEHHSDKEASCEATIRVKIPTSHSNGDHELTVAIGDGPVNALDNALRKALEPYFPIVRKMTLVDYKVRTIMTQAHLVGTASVTRVNIASNINGSTAWTVGVGKNIINASMQAIIDSFLYAIMQSAQSV
jgi:2-isopropylmalate synthase